MKRKQLVKVRATGPHNDVLVRQLHQANARLLQVQQQEQTLTFLLERRYLTALRRANRQAKSRLTLRYEQQGAFWRRSVTHVGLLLLWVIPFLCAQFIWSVQMIETTPEVQHKIAQITTEQLVLPLWKRSAPSDHSLRMAMMANDSKLAWVHLSRKGSKVFIQPLLAPTITEIDVAASDSHLIATSGGVITHFELQRGVRVVQPNSTVARGDLLVSGVVMEGEKAHIVGAEGAVFADYWLEVSFTLPRTVKVTTQQTVKWQLTNEQQAASYSSYKLAFLPLYLEAIPQQEVRTVTLDEDAMETIIKPLLQLKILRTLPEKTTIKTENVLHVTFDDDTVKGHVLFLINENIATPDPIVRGE